MQNIFTKRKLQEITKEYQNQPQNKLKERTT